MIIIFSLKAGRIEIFLKKSYNQEFNPGYSFSTLDFQTSKPQESMFPKQLLCLWLPIHH